MNSALFFALLGAAAAYHIAKPGLDKVTVWLWGGNAPGTTMAGTKRSGESIRSTGQ